MSFYATVKNIGPPPMTGNVEASHRKVSREKKVFVYPDPPFSNIGHFLSGESNTSQFDGILEKVGIQPQDAVQLQSGGFLNTLDTYDLKKSGTFCIGTAKAHGGKKTMAPRSNEDFPGLQETDLTEKPRKHEKENETQEGPYSTDEIIELCLQLFEDYDKKSNLDWRMPMPSATQIHATFDQVPDLAPNIQPTEIQSMTNQEKIEGNQGSLYQGNPQSKPCNLEGVCGKDQCIKDNSYQNKTCLSSLFDVIELESDLGQENSKEQMVHDSGTMAFNEMTCGDLLIDVEVMKDLIECDTGTVNAKKETSGELLKDNELMKNQKSHGIGTAASGAVTCRNSLDPELLKLCEFVIGTDDSKEVSQQHLQKDTKLMKNQMTHGTGTTRAADFEKVTQQNVLKDTKRMKIEMGCHTDTSVNKAEGCGGLQIDTELINRMGYDTKTANAKEVTHENLPMDTSLMENNMVSGDLLTGIKLRKDQMGFDTGADNTDIGIIHGTEEDLEKFAQNHTKFLSDLPCVCTDEIPKTSTKNRMTDEMMSAKEIMSENETYRRRLIKKRLKRTLQNRNNETVSKVRRTSDASQSFQEYSQGGIFEENGGVLKKGNQKALVETSHQGLTETDILVEKQFPMFDTWEFQHPMYKAKLQESSFGNMPNLDDLGVNMYGI
ncbi:uncharacterized protein LOC133173279 [Saccostrea echinata]|uniref:uncharacterized protein LOC133173279 n=1 Tax=Saccostrea echinata TaxID=191078 RepID=UPI002A837AEE|nr:uncharacterized protein LOC133173279 [Saccostrea echinata]